MALERTANAKPMSELSILTILVQAAAIVKNEDGDGTLHGYVELQGNRRAMESDDPQPEVELAVLESIGDVLLLNHRILALTHNKGNQEEPFVASVVTSDLKAESQQIMSQNWVCKEENTYQVFFEPLLLLNAPGPYHH